MRAKAQAAATGAKRPEKEPRHVRGQGHGLFGLKSVLELVGKHPHPTDDPALRVGAGAPWALPRPPLPASLRSLTSRYHLPSLPLGKRGKLSPAFRVS